MLLKNDRSAAAQQTDQVDCGDWSKRRRSESGALSLWTIGVESVTVLRESGSFSARVFKLITRRVVMLLTNAGRNGSVVEPLTAAERAGIDAAVEAVKRSEVAVVVLGDSRRTVGESLSRTSLDLPGRQLELVQAVHAVGKPVVVVLLNGRPLSINWVNKFVPAIVEGWFPGAQGGMAIAEVLFGDYNPSGKLTVTFPKTAGQIPFNFPTKPNAQWEGEKSRVSGALYHFGHGLSYTTFAYSNLKIIAAPA